MNTTITNTLALIKKISKNSGEPVADFLLNLERDKLEAIKQENLDLLFAEAKKFKVRFIFVGTGEICGCEEKTDQGGTWPAMWSIAKNVGFPGSCGNSDQYQCHNADKVFPKESYGAWDLALKQKLTHEETAEKKFKYVVTRPEYAKYK